MATEQDFELGLFRETVSKVLQKHVVPFYSAWEQQRKLPSDIWHTLGSQGLLCVDIPEQWGGCGAEFAYAATVIEQMSWLNLGALAVSTLVHSDVVAHYLLNHGSEQQQQGYLPAMAAGKRIGAIAMTEPGCGSDLQNLQTTAVLHDDRFLLNGSKTFITNGQYSDFVIVAAKTDLQVAGAKGISLFIVDSNSVGFQRGRKLDKIGLHASDTSELFFDDLELPHSALLGPINSGFGLLMQELPRERLMLGVAAVAAAEGMLTMTIDYVQQRRAFGQPLSALQHCRHRLAELHTQVQINKAFIKQCLTLHQQQSLDAATASMAKLSATEMQGQVADQCLQLFGGYGYMLEYGISRAFVDARVQRIYGGTSEIMKELISRTLLAK